MRRVMLAMMELEKNLIVSRLTDGRKRKQEQRKALVKSMRKAGKKLSPEHITQKGCPKSCGSRSLLERMGTFTRAQTRALQQAIREQRAGRIGWRVLKEKFEVILGTEIGSHETARRFAKEFSFING